MDRHWTGALPVPTSQDADINIHTFHKRKCKRTTASLVWQIENGAHPHKPATSGVPQDQHSELIFHRYAWGGVVQVILWLGWSGNTVFRCARGWMLLADLGCTLSRPPYDLSHIVNINLYPPDGPQQGTRTINRSPFAIPSFRSSWSLQGAQKVREASGRRCARYEGSPSWRSKEWWKAFSPHFEGISFLPRRGCSPTEKEPQITPTCLPPIHYHSRHSAHSSCWSFPREEGCILEAVGEWIVVGHRPLQGQRCSPATREPGVRDRYLDTR